MISVYGPWAAELTLEAIGAALYFKRSKILSAYFAITALMDVVTFAVFRYWPEVYPTATWSRHGIRNLILIWLGCSICGMFSEKRVQSAITAAFLSLGTAALVLSVGLAGETIKDKLLDAEIVACFVLLAYVALAWIGGRTLESDNKWKAAGFLVMIGSDLIFTLLWLKWDGARHWYPLGAIAAQLVWIIGPLRSVKLPECRADLGHKITESERISVC